MALVLLVASLLLANIYFSYFKKGSVFRCLFYLMEFLGVTSLIQHFIPCFFLYVKEEKTQTVT